MSRTLVALRDRLMDVLADLLARARARGALFARTELRGDWGLAFSDGTPLAFHTVLGGEAWLRRDDARDWLRVGAGDVVLVRAPAAHRVAHAPDAPTVALEDVRDRWRVGERRFRSPGGAEDPTVLLCGAYGFDGSLCDSLLAALPPVVHLERPGGALGAALALMAAELDDPAPGAQTVLDRLLDTVLVFALRAHFAEHGGDRLPPWWRALADPEVGRALGRLHAEPARAWTIAALAAEVGLSRAALARRFTALVGRPPLQYLTDLRIRLAEERLRDPRVKLATVAAEVGYGSEFAFSAAFKRHRGLAPSAWRRAAA
jgi:AraC-like DNA-binding protein